MKRRTQNICAAQKGPQCEVWLQLPLQRAGFHIRRTGWCRWTASNTGKSTLKVELKVELRLQPKIGRLAHQAAVDLGSAGYAKSSREQAQPTTLARGIKPAGVRQMWHCTRTRGPHYHMLQSGQLTQ